MVVLPVFSCSSILVGNILNNALKKRISQRVSAWNLIEGLQDDKFGDV